MTAARQRLRGAAQHGAARAGDAYRNAGEAARGRTKRAAGAIRGDQPPTRWRWLAGGFAAGGALVATAGTALIRARHSAARTPDRAAPEQPGTARKAADAVVAAATEPGPTVRKAASAAATAVRDGTSTAAHQAADGARHTVARAREAIRGNDDHPSDQPGTDGAKPSERSATNRATAGKAGTDR